MKRITLQRPLLTLVAATLLTCAADAMAANCSFNGSPSTQTLSYGGSLANGGLTIPADTPDGTVVYQETAQQSSSHSWSCNASSFYGNSGQSRVWHPDRYRKDLPPWQDRAVVPYLDGYAGSL